MSAATVQSPSAPSLRHIDRNDWWKKPVGAALGGIVEGFCFHPLDTVKTNMQASRNSHSFTRTLQYIYNKNNGLGMRNFYKGLTPVTMNLSMKYIIRYGVNYRVREILAGDSGTTTTLQNVFAGLVAGCTEAVVLVTPFECIKTKMQTNAQCNGSLACVVKYIIQKDGVSGMWRGVVPTVIRQSTNGACMFSSYTFMKVHFYQDKTPNSRDAFLMGLVSSAVGPLCNTPIDTIKTKLMKQTTGDERYGRSMVGAFKVIIKNEGFKSLYKGLSMRLLRLCPGQATVWAVTERFNKALQTYDM